MIQQMMPCMNGVGWMHLVIIVLQLVQGVVIALLTRHVKNNGDSHRRRYR